MPPMPKVPKLRGRTPVKVRDAATAFGSEFRLRLIRHYIDHPGSQAEAARALGVSTAALTRNTQVLVALRLITETPVDDKRTKIYSVDLDRYDELVKALHDYAHPTGQ